MNYKNGITFGSLFLQALNGCLSAQEPASKPNIVYVMTDQQSYNMISGLSKYNTLNPNYSSTPNIDRLVRSGISFTNAYCANPLSVPSRFALFTGEYGGKYGVRGNLPKVDNAQLDELFKKSAMGNIFIRNGYQTYYGGKVHLPFPKRNSKFDHPINYGFQEYISKDDADSLAITAADLIRNRTSKTPFLLVASFNNPHNICAEAGANEKRSVNIKEGRPEISNDVMDMRRKADAFNQIDFFNNVAPALPVNFDRTIGFPTDFMKWTFHDWSEDYWRRYRWIYSQMTTEIDTSIGRILDAIDQSKFKDNTIIIFTADHGEMQGAHHASLKELPFDECQRIPFIIAGKGIVQNQVDNSLVCNGTDLIPTMCELAGIPIPSNLKGISLAKRATSNAPVIPRKYMYLEGTKFSQIIENQKYKYTHFDAGSSPEMLIDLSVDPGEKKDVSTGNKAYKAKTAELRNELSIEQPK